MVAASRISHQHPENEQDEHGDFAEEKRWQNKKEKWRNKSTNRRRSNIRQQNRHNDDETLTVSCEEEAWLEKKKNMGGREEMMLWLLPTLAMGKGFRGGQRWSHYG
ncbi:hypothetical protein PIB30_096622, partial [Stylosanthes scabra]|nr:hypothetical protein [Stylosanthes scabra]